MELAAGFRACPGMLRDWWNQDVFTDDEFFNVMCEAVNGL